ncbi:MAG TPA: hypothetical protein VL307_12350 [Chitinophagaceae bacterium]|nr:hypothetical protein [Chitinophagaceae bacterium]
MRNMIIAAGIILYTCTNSFSQETYRHYIPKDSSLSLLVKPEPKFTVNLHTGYAMALGSTFKFYPDDVSSIVLRMQDNNVTSKDIAYKAPRKGLGEGFRVGAGFSYVLNDFINVGLDVDYFRSTISKVRDSSFTQVLSTGAITEKSYSERYTISYDATLLTFTPNITLKAISRPKWFLYNKVGAVITIRPNSVEHDSRQSTSSMQWQGFRRDSASFTDTRYEWSIRNPSFGFSGGLGAQYKITERIRVYAEVQFSHVVFVVRRRETTSYTIDGREMVNTLTLNQKQIDFEKNFSTDEWIPDPNKPDKAVTQRIPITYAGMQTGIVYRF